MDRKRLCSPSQDLILYWHTVLKLNRRRQLQKRQVIAKYKETYLSHHYGVKWCIINMVTAMRAKAKEGSDGAPRTMRASVSFPADLYQTLEDLARQKKVSVAWVVREAAEKYVEAQWPLLTNNN